MGRSEEGVRRRDVALDIRETDGRSKRSGQQQIQMNGGATAKFKRYTLNRRSYHLELMLDTPYIDIINPPTHAMTTLAAGNRGVERPESMEMGSGLSH